MTFNPSAWAIDGAWLQSSLARRALFASTSGAWGVISASDLKVQPLAVPGVGIRIGAGAGVVLNGYESGTPSQSYVVENPGDHTIPAASMPPVSSTTQFFIVAATVGDPEFSQAGHPWMTSSDPAEGIENFDYVRPWLIPVAGAPTTQTVSQIANGSLGYPVLPLALLTIPANTSTITADMITDLRRLVHRRVEIDSDSQQPFNSALGANQSSFVVWVTSNASSSVGVEKRLGDKFSPSYRVPDWATKMQIKVTVPSILLSGMVFASAVDKMVFSDGATVSGSTYDMRNMLFSNTSGTSQSADAQSSTDQIMLIDSIDVSARQGQTVAPQLWMKMTSNPTDGTLSGIFPGTAAVLSFEVTFSEDAI